MEILRKEYLDKLSALRKHNDVVKILTGMRRSGKSTLLRQFIDVLKTEGISEKQIVYINMESLSNIEFRDNLKLYNHIMSKSMKKKRLYILLDEIQNIDGWEKTVSSLLIDIDCDIYVTGSNAYMLSTELSTFLTGRSLQIRILPLSFSEFREMNDPERKEDRVSMYNRYVHLGSMPFIRPEYEEMQVFERLDEIKSDIILKDICNRKRTVDPNKIRRMIDYLFSEIGNQISSENISGDLKISTSTANNYLDIISESLMFNEVKRFDLKGKNVLKTLGKYYCTDLGMRNTQPITSDRDYGHILENIVYLELIRRGFDVYIGKIGAYEIDFVAVRDRKISYYQVATTIVDDDVFERETRPFDLITDICEKILITADPIVSREYIDVRIVNIIDFLDG